MNIQPKGGGFDQAAVAALRAAARRDGAVSTRRVVCPQHGSAALAVGESVHIDRRVRAHVSRSGIRNAEVFALIAAADQHGPPACVAGGVDLPAEQADVVAGSRDVAAGLPRARAGSVQRAADAHNAALHVAQKQDGAIAVFDALSLNHAGVVDCGLQQVAGRLGC